MLSKFKNNVRSTYIDANLKQLLLKWNKINLTYRLLIPLDLSLLNIFGIRLRNNPLTQSIVNLKNISHTCAYLACFTLLITLSYNPRSSV